MRIFDGLEHGMGRRVGIQRLAQWWTQATQEARFTFLRSALDARSPTKGTPTLEEIRVAIILAEAAAGEIDPASS